MRVLIANVQVPFIRGGAEVLAEGLRDALRAAGHEADIATIPFNWSPPERIVDHILACRLLDLTSVAGTTVDRLIGLKFPAYLIPHPNKVIWLIHQHWAAYNFWDKPWGELSHAPNGAAVRDTVVNADRHLIPEAQAVFAISRTVSERLRAFSGIDSTPLYPPPPSVDDLHWAPPEDYLFFPSRISFAKRQNLVLAALSQTREPVRVRFAGNAEPPAERDVFEKAVHDLGLRDRVEWTGFLPEREKVDAYARSLGVVFPPLEEDFGYVTSEAMLSSKPVITCSDSGGPLELVVHDHTGLVVEPAPEALAGAMDRLWADRDLALHMGEEARSRYDMLGISWQGVIERLLT
jgi:glycosyltransferase involved in cell wall biosynthesis